MPEGRMRCRLRVAEPFTNEKVTLCSVTRCRATPHSSAPPPPSPQRGRLTVGFCFADRDFPTASPPITSFSFSEKEKEGKRKTTQGTAPRSEPRFAPANRDEIKIRGSMRLRPPRPPGERASRESQTTEMLCTAEKVSVFGAKAVRSAFPSRGRLFSSR